MNRKTISFKVDDHAITLHRGGEEPEEIKQKQMTLYTTCLHKIAGKLIIKCIKKNFPDLQIDEENIIQKQ